VAPVYPVNTVAELAQHLSNSVDVCVVVNDAKQPLCVDGHVANGAWGPLRPPSAETKDPKKEPSPLKEDKPEDAALELSPVVFQSPREKELKMDLRWLLHHITGTITKTFGLKSQTGESQLLLFNAPPSSSCEEPLNLHTARSEETTLKDLQRSALYVSTQAKKPLRLHAVELPFQPGRQVFERDLSPLCVRFYDDAVREVGSCVIAVSNNGNIQDVINVAKDHLKPEWGIRGNLRVLEVAESRVHKVYRAETPVRQLLCFGKNNIFFHCLRVEVDSELQDGQKPIEIYHCDRQSVAAFAQPVLLAVSPGEKSGSVKNRCKAKLRVPDGEFKSWRLVRVAQSGRTHLKDDEAWDADTSPEAKLCLEHVNPNPTNYLARQSRSNKPLTIN